MNWTIAQIASVVLCAMSSGLVLSSLGHSPVLGYIIAGIVLGPSCLKFITDREVVAVFSEMGILFLLFAIGLGLSFEKVKNMWKMSFSVTLISLLFVYTATSVVAYFLNIPQTGVVLISFCVTLSSTAVTVKSLKLLKERNDNVEDQTFGILIAQDVLSLVMVLVINFMGTALGTGTQTNDTARIVATFVFLAIVAVVIMRFQTYAEKLATFIRRHTDMLAMFVVGVCLGSAVISELFGLSASFGAFVAGLILGNSAMQKEISTIAAPIEEILLMTFFLSVGLLVDLDFIKENFSLICLGILFITVGKTIINIFVLRICKFDLKESFVISVLLGHIGEFSFMLSYAACNVGLVDAYGVKFLVSLTALSLFLSPFWLIFAERCRAITANVHVSVWQFSQIALGREFDKMRKVGKETKEFLKPLTINTFFNLKKYAGSIVQKVNSTIKTISKSVSEIKAIKAEILNRMKANKIAKDTEIKEFALYDEQKNNVEKSNIENKEKTEENTKDDP